MKKINKVGAQGDVMFVRVDGLPDNACADDQRGEIIVAHSETGHHHVIERGAKMYTVPENPLIAYLEVQIEMAKLIHKRPHDTHQTLGLGRGVWKIYRQREYTPEGWRLVQD